MIGAMILAAGNSRRFGENKLLYEIDGCPMYRHVLEHLKRLLREEKIGYLVLVMQYDAILQSLSDTDVVTVKNTQPELGISHSIALGIQKLLEVASEAEGCLFTVADQPCLTYESLEGLIAVWQKSKKGIAACAHQESIGNPVVFSKDYFAQLLELSGDKGGKQIVKRNLSDTVLYQVQEKELMDVDEKRVLKKL